LQILKSLVRGYFYFPTVSGAHDLCSNNSDVFHNRNSFKNERINLLLEIKKIVWRIAAFAFVLLLTIFGKLGRF
jgi:hypothetical protein